jgi:hypothetical protein
MKRADYAKMRQPVEGDNGGWLIMLLQIYYRFPTTRLIFPVDLLYQVIYFSIEFLIFVNVGAARFFKLEKQYLALIVGITRQKFINGLKPVRNAFSIVYSINTDTDNFISKFPFPADAPSILNLFSD